MKRAFLIVLIIVAGGAGGVILNNSRVEPAKPEVRGQLVEVATEKISLTVEDRSEKKVYELNFRDGMTALEATKLVVAGNMTIKGEGTMAYVTGIAGRLADERSREFWEFLVNGKQAEVGAGTYVVQKGDIITWRVNSY